VTGVDLAATRWAKTWERAWPAKDVDAIAALYSPGATYRSHPHRVAEEGGALGYMTRTFADEAAVNCRFGVPITTDDRAAVEWWATLTEGDSPATLSGCTVLRFGTDGLVIDHVDYWVHSGQHVDTFDGWGGEVRAHDLMVHADYYQFYVCDRGSPCDTSVIWDEPGSFERQLAVGERLIAVGTKRYAEVPVRIEIHRVEPTLDTADWDLVNECGLEITTALEVGNPISATPIELPIEPGTYGVLVASAGQSTVIDDWHGDDRYVLMLWPTAEVKPVRTRWRAP
jgi:hypothetical protein